MPRRRRHRAPHGATKPDQVPSPRMPPHDTTGTPERITTPAQADSLAAALLDKSRTQPVVVVSMPSDISDPRIDVDTIRAELGDLTPVVVLETVTASWRFAEQMPPMTQVYGGAGRVYPIDPGWQTNPYNSPLRLVCTPQDAVRSTGALIDDALRLAIPAPTRPAPASHAVSGIVTGTTEARAMVTLDDGGFAITRSPFTDVDIDSVFSKGMTVSGIFDPLTKQLAMAREPLEAPLPYVDGSVVLTKVDQVTASTVTLKLHPDIAIDVDRLAVTDNPLDRLDDLFSVGERVLARFGHAGAEITLRLDDIDDDEQPLRAVALLPGGPPWLDPPPIDIQVECERLKVTIPAPHPDPDQSLGPAPAAARPHDPTTQRLELALMELSQLRRRVAELSEDNSRLFTKIKNQKTNLRKRVTGERKSRRPQPATSDLSSERDLRTEIYGRWLDRFTGQDRDAHPLPHNYVILDTFHETLRDLQIVSREKVLDVVVEVLTDTARTMSSREMHPLRSGPGGSDPVVTRADNAKAWRVSVQIKSPSAARLHFWKRQDDVYELSRVVKHDDMTP